MSLFKILSALSTFDWVSPTVGIVHVARGDKPISIYWSRKPPVHYERILKSNGIRVTSRTVVSGNGFVITVSARQEERARRILGRARANLA